MPSKYRLNSPVFERKNEEKKESPKKVFFLSVEGNKTEVEYFDGVEKFKERLDINAVVAVEVLRRSSRDTNSAPEKVVELLEEFIRLRDMDANDIVNELVLELSEDYSEDIIRSYLLDPNSISFNQRKAFENDLKLIGYDLNYRKYLRDFDRNEGDRFCIIIDRDIGTTPDSDTFKKYIEHCKSKNYLCFVSNPCFEFWLLLHLCDVKSEYVDKYDELLKNRTVSCNHTYLSLEVSRKAHHSKSWLPFEYVYLPCINKAIERSKKYETNIDNLVYNVGTNLGDLLRLMIQS